MASDIHGNVLNIGDQVYICATKGKYGKCKSLLYGEVLQETKGKVVVWVFENNSTHSLISNKSVVKPME